MLKQMSRRFIKFKKIKYQYSQTRSFKFLNWEIMKIFEVRNYLYLYKKVIEYILWLETIVRILLHN